MPKKNISVDRLIDVPSDLESEIFYYFYDQINSSGLEINFKNVTRIISLSEALELKDRRNFRDDDSLIIKSMDNVIGNYRGRLKTPFLFNFRHNYTLTLNGTIYQKDPNQPWQYFLSKILIDKDCSVLIKEHAAKDSLWPQIIKASDFDDSKMALDKYELEARSNFYYVKEWYQKKIINYLNIPEIPSEALDNYNLTNLLGKDVFAMRCVCFIFNEREIPKVSFEQFIEDRKRHLDKFKNKISRGI